MAGRTRRVLATTLLILVGGYAGWLVLLYLVQDRLMFPRHVLPVPSGPVAFERVEVLRREIEGGAVEAWLLRPRGDAPAGGWPVVMFFHGNAELIDFAEDIVGGYHGLGYAVLAVEYRGYGRSASVPSQEGIREDAIHFHDRLEQLADVDPSRVIFHGRSIGAAIAIDLAAHRRPSALIGQSAFTSVRAMAHKFAAPGWLVHNPFDSDRILPTLDMPVLLMHGTRDEIVPVSQGRRLREIATDATWIEYECGHNDFPGAGNLRDMWQRIGAFVHAADHPPP
ncbi:MAG: hypothetical protein CMJ18_08690 [Phycisphaeraceae bacterium]|nr:hypothetical protein [Phycisphaeraceae bacterium]